MDLLCYTFINNSLCESQTSASPLMHSPFELRCPDLCSCNPCSILCGHSRGIPAAVTLPSLSKPRWRNLPGRSDGAARQVTETLESGTHWTAPSLKMAERAEPAGAKQICNTCSTCTVEITTMWVSLLVPDRPTRSAPIHCIWNLNFIKVQVSEGNDKCWNSTFFQPYHDEISVCMVSNCVVFEIGKMKNNYQIH